MDRECIFCEIACKRKPSEMVFEDDKTVVFKDIRPKAPVHLLIVPKKHVLSIADLTEEDRGLAGDLVFMAKRMALEAGLDGYRLIFNVGRQGGQLVDHIHLHLLGGWKGHTGEDFITTE